MSLRVDHVGVAAADVAASRAFYTALLAGEATTRAGHTLVSAGGVHLAIVPRGPADPVGVAHGHHLALALPASERPALEARLAALGAPWEDVRGRLYTRDPDGMAVEFLFD